MQALTPLQIVEHLDRFVIGQAPAKRAVAVAVRNRWRRQQLDAETAAEVSPKNIIMMGPTGVGKTEIARRLATLTGAPFIKVEASKFTEVGYHGRDVESMIRDLVDQSIAMVRLEKADAVKSKADDAALERLVDLVMPPLPRSGAGAGASDATGDHNAGDDSSTDDLRGHVPTEQSGQQIEQRRRRIREQIEAGALDEREVTLSLTSKPATSAMFANMGMDQMDPEMSNMFERMIPEQTKRRRVTVAEARRILTAEETDALLDTEKITTEAVERAQNSGIVFLDEIDKIATPGGAGGSGSPDVSRQGVQRDLLPIVEGSTVNTRHGVVHTDHILFIAAGAFHSAAVSDLMPELQGRFPIRVELSALNKDDFVRILTEPRNALTHQQTAMLGVESLEIEFQDAAIHAIAELAAQANATLENIGARRLMTIVERVFEDISFDAPERVAAGETSFVVTESFVREQVASIVQDEDLGRFVL